jgi:hypothetical protein
MTSMRKKLEAKRIEEEVEPVRVTLLDVFYKLMAQSMNVTKEEAQQIFRNNNY